MNTKEDLEVQLNSLTEELAKFFSRTADWNERKLNFRLSHNDWNALQIMEHLINSELGTMSYLKKKCMSKASDIPDTNDENRKKGDQLSKALNSTKKWKAPLVLPTPKGSKSRKEMIDTWKGMHSDMQRFMMNLSEEYYGKEVYKHPQAGRLNLSQTIDFLKDHIVHHEHQLDRIEQAYERL